MLKKDVFPAKYGGLMMVYELKALPLQPHYCTTFLFFNNKVLCI